MTSNEIVLRVIQELDRVGIPYMLVGSYSSNAYGIARSTQDADFVIECEAPALSRLFDALKDVIDFDPQMQMETVTMTLRHVGRHRTSGFKVELFSISGDPHDRERFQRRRCERFMDGTASLPTAEDVIIQKLRWFHRARRAKDRDDAINVLAVQSGKLDMDYIRRWCDGHGTRELLEKLLAEVP